MRNRRTFPALVGGGLLLVLFFPTTSGTPAVPVVGTTDDSPERRALLAELDHWAHLGERTFAVFDNGALQGRARGFSLYNGEVDEAGRRAMLAGIPYGAFIEEAAARYHLDGLLLAAVVRVESGFDAHAVSPRGAQGLMQLMPTTAASYGAAKPADPRANVRAGARYLRDLLLRFDGDLELALAAYNAGPAAVRRYRGMPPYRETREYVDRVLTLYLDYHRTLWQEAQVARMMARLPAEGAGSPAVATTAAR